MSRHHTRFLVASAAGFLVAGVALYARALGAGFVADDWEFLFLVDRAGSMAVSFDLLVGRFVRPLVVLVYYIGYRLFGLWPAPYHFLVVAVHILNAWLLCLLTVRIDAAGRRSVGLATGAIFLAFAGHSEAVTWVAGMADTLLAAFVFGMLLALHSMLDCPRPHYWMALGWLLFLGAMLSKETSVVMPAVAAAYGGVRIWSCWSAHGYADCRLMARRLLVFIGVLAALAAAYWVVRAQTYGDPLSAYGGLGSSHGMVLAQGRAFVIRCFLPPSTLVLHAWLGGDDVWWLAAGVVVFALLVIARPSNRRALLFGAIGLGITLAPALPFTISLNSSETERVVYIPSAFAALVTVLAIDGATSLKIPKMALISGLVVAHGLLLQRMHERWLDAGRLFQTVTQSFVETARAHDPGPAGSFFLLNYPDSLRGAYVFRRGFHASLHLTAPDLGARSASIIGVASQTMDRPDAAVEARRVGALDVSLDAGANLFLNAAPPERPFFAFSEWSRSRYRLRFTPVVNRAAVLYVSKGRTHHLAQLTGVGAPFGVVDVPQDGARCDGRITFSGWALDDDEVTTVIVSRRRAAGDAHGEGPIALGEATWAYHSRPDVAGAYAGYPNLERSGWDYHLSCALVSGLGEEQATVHIVAVDREGQRTEIGVRTIVVRP